MLVIEALTTEYGAVRALDDVSIHVPAGTITAVLGANGAGKTTLLRTISGLVRASAGSVQLAGKDITRMSGRRDRASRPCPRSRRKRRDR